MPKDELETILQIISDRDDDLRGRTLQQIIEDLNHSIPRRTLQRYLAILVEQGKLLSEGQTRSRRYILPFSYPAQSWSFREVDEKENNVALTPAAKLIQFEISRPLHKRRLVNYNRKFLDYYQPNKTYYLSEAIRQDLMSVGKPPMQDQPSGAYARLLLKRLLIDLSWNSSRLEGNTYSLLETQQLISFGKILEGKDIQDTQMILNHKSAIEFLVSSSSDIGINRYTILNLHALLSNNLLRDVQACGKLRSIPVGIAHSTYHPANVLSFVEEIFDQILQIAKVIVDPFERSFFLMVHLPYLQPFENANKRVSRLALNIPFFQANLCPISFVDVPRETYINGILAIYELNRTALLKDIFVWAYKRSCSLYSTTCQTLGAPDPFRMQYRNIIHLTIYEIISQQMDLKTALIFIKKQATTQLPSHDQSRFGEIIESELMGLHEGNIARYRLHLADFHEWQKKWN